MICVKETIIVKYIQMLRSDLLTNWSSDLTPTQVFDFNSGETENS